MIGSEDRHIKLSAESPLRAPSENTIVIEDKPLPWNEIVIGERKSADGIAAENDIVDPRTILTAAMLSGKGGIELVKTPMPMKYRAAKVSVLKPTVVMEAPGISLWEVFRPREFHVQRTAYACIQRARHFRQQGRTHLMEMQLSRSRNLLEGALLKDPTSLCARALLLATHLFRCSFMEAKYEAAAFMENLNEKEKLKMDDPVIYLAIAHACWRLDCRNSAFAILSGATETFPNHPHVCLLLSELCVATGKWPVAKDMAQLALIRDESKLCKFRLSPTHRQRALCCLSLTLNELGLPLDSIGQQRVSQMSNFSPEGMELHLRKLQTRRRRVVELLEKAPLEVGDTVTLTHRGKDADWSRLGAGMMKNTWILSKWVEAGKRFVVAKVDSSGRFFTVTESDSLWIPVSVAHVHRTKVDDEPIMDEHECCLQMGLLSSNTDAISVPLDENECCLETSHHSSGELLTQELNSDTTVQEASHHSSGELFTQELNSDTTVQEASHHSSGELRTQESNSDTTESVGEEDTSNVMPLSTISLPLTREVLLLKQAEFKTLSDQDLLMGLMPPEITMRQERTILHAPVKPSSFLRGLVCFVCCQGQDSQATAAVEKCTKASL